MHTSPVQLKHLDFYSRIYLRRALANQPEYLHHCAGRHSGRRVQYPAGTDAVRHAATAADHGESLA
jgi:hypothetical protein